MKYCRTLAFATCLAVIPMAGAAMAGTAPAPPTAMRAHPARGMSMQQVRTRFGAPQKILAPAPPTSQGPLKPPIVRWVYPDFTVYFAHGYVIHAVLTHPRQAPTPHTSNGGNG